MRQRACVENWARGKFGEHERGVRVESNSVCNHTSDNKIGRSRSGSPICLSRVWLQTELDDTKSYYQLIIKITISEKRKIAKLCDNGKIYIKKLTI